MAGRSSQDCLAGGDESDDSAISISVSSYSAHGAYGRQYSQEIEDLRSTLQEKDQQISDLEQELQRQHGVNELTRRVERLEIKFIGYEATQQENDLRKELEKKDEIIKDLQKQLQAAKQTSLEAHSQGSDNPDGTPVKRSRSVTNWEFVLAANGTPKVLGSGAYGTVHEGYCRSTGCKVAIKAMKPPGPNDPEVKQMTRNILSEIATLSSLDHHQRIVAYLGASYRPHPIFKEEHLFIVTEFMEGGSLRDYIRTREAGLSDDIECLRSYTRQVLEGVCFLHQLEPVILHRDIKGGNILMDKTHTSIKLADFGCAKEVLLEHFDCTSKTSNMYGTIPWAAPEVLRQEKACKASDVWSVAATAVEMFTGKTPYKARMSVHQILMQVGAGRMNPMQTPAMQEALDNGRVPADLEEFLSACFKLNANERPSAGKLLSDFSFCQVRT